MAPSLVSLPSELVDNIAFQLVTERPEDHDEKGLIDSTQPLFSFRRTCSTIGRASRRQFIDRFFYRRQLEMTTSRMMSQLSQLLAISRIQDLAEGVKVSDLHCELEGVCPVAVRKSETTPEEGFEAKGSHQAILCAPLLTIILRGECASYHFLRLR